MPLLRFDSVSKTYPGPHAALSELSFSVNEGEMLFVTGHSGAGKSTLLKLIHLSERPSRGTVLLDDRNLAKVRGRQVALHRRKVGVVHQDHRLLMDRSVFDNVALPLLIAGTPSSEIGRRVRVTLDKLGLGAREKALPRQLSAGEQQRVGIARAVAMEPKVLLLDEITSALDPELVGEVLAVVRKLAKDGMTMLLVTHEMSFAREVSDLVVFMDAGKIVIKDSPANVLENPKHERLKAFLSRLDAMRRRDRGPEEPILPDAKVPPP